MKEIQKDLGCAAFQAQLPDLIGTGADISQHPHVQNCDLCRSFMADLEAIAKAARDLFPVEEPADRIWEEIESRIIEEAGDDPEHVHAAGQGMTDGAVSAQKPG